MSDRFTLVMLNDSGVTLGLPVDFRGTIHAYTREPKRWFNVRAEDGHVIVSECFD